MASLWGPSTATHLTRVVGMHRQIRTGQPNVNHSERQTGTVTPVLASAGQFLLPSDSASGWCEVYFTNLEAVPLGRSLPQ